MNPPDRTPRERFDPPLLRVRWTTAIAQSRDEFLADARERCGWDAAHFDSMLWHGGLHLDGKPHAGDEVPDTIAAGTRVDAYAFCTEPEPIAVGAERVLADHEDWLAVDKPAWLTTQRTRASRRLSLEAALRALTGCASLVAVHRLDRETSGVVLFAKTPEAAARLGRIFAEGGAHKRYLAIVSPVPPDPEWEVSGFLGRVLDPQRYRFALRDEPEPGFRFSHTRFTRRARRRRASARRVRTDDGALAPDPRPSRDDRDPDRGRRRLRRRAGRSHAVARRGVGVAWDSGARGARAGGLRVVHVNAYSRESSSSTAFAIFLRAPSVMPWKTRPRHSPCS